MAVAAVTLMSIITQYQHCTVIKESDGCSVPFGLDVPYKDVFTPACYHHDACYRCVSVKPSLSNNFK